MKALKCPTCGKALTKAEYERALKIRDAREAHFHRREEEFKRKALAREDRLRDRERMLKTKLRDESARIRRLEKARAERSKVGLKQALEKANEEIRRLRSGTTPQTDGLEFEGKLTARLRREFPEDEILQKGKGGDILHTVRSGKKAAGVIIYECKRTPRIESSHVTQAHAAKESRQADFAVLVTTARKKGFSGFAEMGGVWVASPLAAIPLASLLREHLIEMLKAKITGEKRAVIAQQLMRYIDSPEFRNPIEAMLRRASKLQEMVKKEARDHGRIWQERWTHYQTIHWSVAQVQANLRLVLNGSAPKQLAYPKPPLLQLSGPSSNR